MNVDSSNHFSSDDYLPVKFKKTLTFINFHLSNEDDKQSIVNVGSFSLKKSKVEIVEKTKTKLTQMIFHKRLTNKLKKNVGWKAKK